MPSQSRLGDTSTGEGCFPPTAVISAVASTVFVNGIAAAVVGSQLAPHTCGRTTHAGSARQITVGSSTVFFEGKQAARIGDTIADGDLMAAGSGNVFTG
jgi:uncharacterized Zn-binding protein involved in type VI secretion